MKQNEFLANEICIGVIRQTKWVLFKPFIVWYFLTLFPFYLLYKNELLLEFYTYFLIWITFVSIYIVYKYLVWFFTKTIITNKRIINIKCYSIFKKEVREFRLLNLLPTKYNHKTIYSLVGAGNLLLNLEGTSSGFEIPRISNVLQKSSDINHLLSSQNI